MIILFNQVKQWADNRLVLEDISFSIKRDEFVFIYDDRAESLSVLRGLLSGRQKPDQGLIRLFNRPEEDNDIFREREIGIVYRKNILLPDRTLEENFRFIMEVMGESSKYCSLRQKKVLKIVGLEGYQSAYPGQLLPHQLVRADIARALLFYPSLLILEDPTIGLDDVNGRAIYRLLQDLQGLRITIIFLCSDSRLLNTAHSRRIIYLKEGKIAAEEKKGYYF